MINFASLLFRMILNLKNKQVSLELPKVLPLPLLFGTTKIRIIFDITKLIYKINEIFKNI